jgi:hypothetical protein
LVSHAHIANSLIDQLDDKFMNSGSGGAPAPQTSGDKDNSSKKDGDKKDSGKDQEKKG